MKEKFNERECKMKQKSKIILSILMCFTILFSLSAVDVLAATKTITSTETGTFEGYDYEYWKDNGTGTMTLTGGGTFNCSWSNINNILFRTGKKLGSTKTYQDYGKIAIDYACNYQPNGNSYMAVYGWTEDPLVEYYIIDSYGTWNPGSQSTLKGSATVDGRTYQLYQNSRTGPSIKGTNTTFQQYWSICTSKRTSGTITVSDHFKAWESKGMKMGKLYEVSMVVEGYQSSGTANMSKMDLIFGNTTDTQAPTAPANLTSTAKTTSSVSLAWTASTDNVGVTGYNIYSGSNLVGTSTTTSYTVSGLTQNTLYGFTVKAKDASGNLSSASNLLSVTTSAVATFKLGDVNGDNALDSIDFALVKQYLLGTISAFPSEQGLKAADFNEDGSVNALDLSAIKQRLLAIQ